MTTPIELGPRTLRALVAAILVARGDSAEHARTLADALLAQLAETKPKPKREGVPPEWKGKCPVCGGKAEASQAVPGAIYCHSHEHQYGYVAPDGTILGDYRDPAAANAAFQAWLSTNP